jgi:hypothetical protein
MFLTLKPIRTTRDEDRMDKLAQSIKVRPLRRRTDVLSDRLSVCRLLRAGGQVTFDAKRNTSQFPWIPFGSMVGTPFQMMAEVLRDKLSCSLIPGAGVLVADDFRQGRDDGNPVAPTTISKCDNLSCFPALQSPDYC